MISHEKKFVFVHIPKTGGMALSKILKPYCDEESLQYSPFREEGNLHARLDEYIITYGWERIKEYTFFTIVRNPWERLLSHAFHHYKQEYGHEGFNRGHFRTLIFFPGSIGLWPNSHFHFLQKGRFHHPNDESLEVFPPLYTLQYLPYIFRPLRYINFHDYTRQVGRILDSLNIEYKPEDLEKKVNTTTHKHYSHYYSQEEMMHVTRTCELDLRAFSYTFEDRKNT
tara:strand:+ start:7280 stop:7957 length:678 start_codon:yes stop_codon:yes gene_type:complete